MKTLTLDYSKWRSGDNLENKLGRGFTELHNKEGYECCLGQFSLQLGCSLKDIDEKCEPSQVNKKILFLNTYAARYRYGYSYIVDTMFSKKAISINDNPTTTPSQKIALLRKLLKTKGLLLKVINRPKK